MKIHICGSYGSGKSTLAKILSKELGIKSYSLDDLKYKIRYSKTNPVKERLKKLHKICSLPNWIIEGTWSDYAEESFKKADVIILIKTSRSLCIYRIIKRQIIRPKYKNDTIIGALRLAKEVLKYHHMKKPVSLYMHNKLIKKYDKKCFTIKKKSDIGKVVKEIKNYLRNNP